MEKEILRKIAHHYGFDNQCQQTIEEMSELTKAICKFWRAETVREKSAAVVDLAEELADVEIMVIQLKLLVGEKPIDKIAKEKLQRQLDRMGREGTGCR